MAVNGNIYGWQPTAWTKPNGGIYGGFCCNKSKAIGNNWQSDIGIRLMSSIQWSGNDNANIETAQGHNSALVEKAAGVPPGPLFQELKAGKTIMLEDGRQINGADSSALPRSTSVDSLPRMQRLCMITLKAGTGLLPTAVDIIDNPHHLKIMELEGAQLPRVIDDPKVDVAIISTTYLQQTGLSPVRDGIFIEDKNSPYVNIIVTREDNKDAENVKAFIQSYQSPEVAKAAETIFNGGAVPGW